MGAWRAVLVVAVELSLIGSGWMAGAQLRAAPGQAKPMAVVDPCEDRFALLGEVNALRLDVTRGIRVALAVLAARGHDKPPNPDNPPPLWVYEADAVWAALSPLGQACLRSVAVLGTSCDAADGCGIVLDGILNVRRIGIKGTPPECARIWGNIEALYGRIGINSGTTLCSDGLAGTAYRLTPYNLHQEPSRWRMPDCTGRALETCRDGLAVALEVAPPSEHAEVVATFDRNEAMVLRWGCGV